MLDDKVEQLLAGRQIGPGQRQDIALQPQGKCAKVVRALMCPRLERAKFVKPVNQEAVLAAPAGIGQSRFEGFAFSAYAAGQTCPDVGQGFELLADMENIAVTGGYRAMRASGLRADPCRRRQQ